MHREGVFDHHRHDYLSLVAAGGTALGQAALGPVPQGYCWYLETYGFGLVGGAHTAEVILALSPDNGSLPAIAAWDGWGIFEDTPAASRGSRNFASPIKIPEGSYVRAVATGGTLAAADVVTVTFQLAVHQLNPSFLMSEEDRRQVLAAHERTGAPLAETATAQRRAV